MVHPGQCLEYCWLTEALVFQEGLDALLLNSWDVEKILMVPALVQMALTWLVH